MDIIRSVLGGAAGGLLSDRLRRHVARLSDPVQHTEPQSSNELLGEIRDVLYATAGSVHPPLRPLRQVVRLFAFPDGGYTVTYEGRSHLNMLTGTAFSLVVESSAGRFTIPVVQGWNNLDLQDGSRLYISSGTIEVFFEYASYVHGQSINGSLPPFGFDQTNEQKVSLYGKNAAAGDTAVLLDSQGNSGATLRANNTTTPITTLSPGDGQGNAITTLTTESFPESWNGTTWDRLRNNTDLTLLASAARTVTTASGTQTNYNGRAVRVDIDITAVAGSPSLVFTIQVGDGISGVWTTVLTSAALTATGHTILQYGISVPTVANLSAPGVLGRLFRVVSTPGTPDSVTYAVSASVQV